MDLSIESHPSLREPFTVAEVLPHIHTVQLPFCYALRNPETGTLEYVTVAPSRSLSADDVERGLVSRTMARDTLEGLPPTTPLELSPESSRLLISIRCYDLTGDARCLHECYHVPGLIAREYLLSKCTDILAPYFPSLIIPEVQGILTSSDPLPRPSLETLHGLYGFVRTVDWLHTTIDGYHTSRLSRMPTNTPDSLHNSYTETLHEQIFRLRALYRTLA